MVIGNNELDEIVIRRKSCEVMIMANGLNLLSLVKKKLKNQTVKASIGYTIGNYLLKGIGFITVPIFARLMTQEDFGNYNTFIAQFANF